MIETLISEQPQEKSIDERIDTVMQSVNGNGPFQKFAYFVRFRYQQHWLLLLLLFLSRAVARVYLQLSGRLKPIYVRAKGLL